MFCYRLTDAANGDLDDIVAYIAKHNPAAARITFDRLLGTAEATARLPLSGVLRDDLRTGVRMKVVGNYLLFYLVDYSAEEVTIIRILHSARDIKPLVIDAPAS